MRRLPSAAQERLLARARDAYPRPVREPERLGRSVAALVERGLVSALHDGGWWVVRALPPEPSPARDYWTLRGAEDREVRLRDGGERLVLHVGCERAALGRDALRSLVEAVSSWLE